MTTSRPRPAASLQYRLTISALVVALLLICGISLSQTSLALQLGPAWKLAAFAALFFACDTVRVEIYLRRHGSAVTLSEVALVVGLFLIPPLGLVLVRILSQALALGVQGWRLGKLFVNVTIAAAEVSVALAVFESFHSSDPTEVRSWLAAYAAMGATLLVSSGSLLVAITTAQGWPGHAAFGHLVLPAAVAGPFNVTIGLAVVMLLKENPASAVLLMVLAGVLVAGYRAYSQFLKQHKSLSELYEFNRAVGAARQDGALADALLSRTRDLLNAEAATLWLPSQGRYPEVRLTARIDSPGVVDEIADSPVVPDDPIRQAVLQHGVTLHFGPKAGVDDPTLRSALRSRHVEEVIAVPLRSGTAVVGCLEVTNRLGDVTYFGAADVRLLETLAAHAAVAVENNRLIDRLRHDAYHDSLTGLANRRRFTAAVEEAIKVDPAPGEVVAVLQFDVANLRDVNDTLGHGAGDRLLAEVGRRLTKYAPDGALVARIGGDEFVVLVRAEGIDGAVAVGVALQYGLSEPFILDAFTLDVSAAVGIALYPEHAADTEPLLQRADVATEAAKNNPRGLQVYSASMESRSVHRLGLVSELRRALDTGALTVHYQPKVALRDNELLGAEVLVRWRHPEHGLVAPGDFVPVAEHTGLILPVTRTVLRSALEQSATWAESGRQLQVAVNLSSRCLADVEFPAEVEAMLAEYKVPAERLTLEITESGMVGDTERPLPALHRLHQLGVRLSLDDFGTGYSSLSYLRRLPVDEVKIDKTFVLGMATDSGDLAIVRSIVDLSRHLGLAAVAEGVETEMTLRLLQEMGCDAAQGFYFSRPLPAERFEAWLAARTECAAATTGRRGSLRVVGV
ncbi:MAG: diguanylate cyclase/phosphodiesterase [Mycobacterium sp.]|nr:diguanylate cyclase/phosphodiesterase [Mycobacterium sp.]